MPSSATSFVHRAAAAFGCAVVALGGLAGCGATAHQARPLTGAAASQTGTAGAADPAGSPSAAPSPSRTPAGAHTRTGPTDGCGSALSSAWASWPMPNPPGLGLPNPASYTDLGDGSVKDNVTCLVWQRDYSPQKLTWAAAKSYCGGLRIGGTGWRLPSRVELSSIMDFTRAGPALDTSALHGVANFFWTGSPWAVSHSPAYAWAMNFYEGLTTNAGNTDGAYFARCVRAPGGAGAATYAIDGGEVHDLHTGLSWQQTGSTQTMSASAASSYCAALALGGHPWRLPSIKELATTVDESRVAPAINRTAFPNTAKSTYYWSSSTAKPDPQSRWGLNYDDGFTNYRNLTAAYARCVR